MKGNTMKKIIFVCLLFLLGITRAQALQTIYVSQIYNFTNEVMKAVSNNYAEADPVWRGVSGTVWNAINSKQPTGNYATGTPVYVEADPSFTDWLAGAGGGGGGSSIVFSNQMGSGATWNGSQFIFAGTETDPIWASEKSGYATGTPLYVEDHTGLATGTPLYVEDHTGLATGTPLYVYNETDPVWITDKLNGFTVGTTNVFLTVGHITNSVYSSNMFTDGTNGYPQWISVPGQYGGRILWNGTLYSNDIGGMYLSASLVRTGLSLVASDVYTVKVDIVQNQNDTALAVLKISGTTTSLITFVGAPTTGVQSIIFTNDSNIGGIVLTVVALGSSQPYKMVFKDVTLAGNVAIPVAVTQRVLWSESDPIWQADKSSGFVLGGDLDMNGNSIVNVASNSIAFISGDKFSVDFDHTVKVVTPGSFEQIITNNTFDTGIEGWVNVYGSGVFWSNQMLRMLRSGPPSSARWNSDMSGTIGKELTLVFDFITLSGTNILYVFPYTNGVAWTGGSFRYAYTNDVDSTPVTQHVELVYSQNSNSTTALDFMFENSTFPAYIDNVYLSYNVPDSTTTPLYVESDPVWTNDKANGFTVHGDEEILGSLIVKRDVPDYPDQVQIWGNPDVYRYLYLKSLTNLWSWKFGGPGAAVGSGFYDTNTFIFTPELLVLSDTGGPILMGGDTYFNNNLFKLTNNLTMGISGGDEWDRGAFLELGGDIASGDSGGGSAQLILKDTNSLFRIRERETWNDILTVQGRTVTIQDRLKIGNTIITSNGDLVYSNQMGTGSLWDGSKWNFAGGPSGDFVTYSATNSIIPNADNAYDLGSPTSAWRDIYVSTGSIHIGNSRLGVQGNDLYYNNSVLSTSIAPTIRLVGEEDNAWWIEINNQHNGEAGSSDNILFYNMAGTGSWGIGDPGIISLRVSGTNLLVNSIWTNPSDSELVANIPSINGNYVYVPNQNASASTGLLYVLDYSNPESPSIVEVITNEYIQGTCGTYDNHLYLVCGVGSITGIVVYDISTPSTPVFESFTSLPVPGQYVNFILFKDNYMYVSEWNTAGIIYTYDISTRTSPTHINSLVMEGDLEYCNNLYLYENYILAIGVRDRYGVLDISGGAPTILSTNTFFTSPAEMYFTAVSGTRMFLYGDGVPYFGMYDITIPTNPILLMAYTNSPETDVYGQGIGIFGNYVIVQGYDNSGYIVQGFPLTLGANVPLVVDGELAETDPSWTSADLGGLHNRNGDLTWDVAVPQPIPPLNQTLIPTLFGTNTPGGHWWLQPNNMANEEIGDQNNALFWDWNNAGPGPIMSLRVEGTNLLVNSVWLDDTGLAISPNFMSTYSNRAYLTTFNTPNYLVVIDYSDPYNPITKTVFTNYYDRGGASGVYDNRLYEFGGDNGPGGLINVYDLTDPSYPVLISSNSTTIGRYGTYAIFNGNYMYISDWGGSSGGYYIYDITDRDHPAYVNIFYPSGNPGGGQNLDFCGVPYKYGNYMYIVGQGNYFGVIDISDPANPVTLINTNINELGDIYFNVSVANDKLFMANDGDYIMDLFDVSQPASPVLINSYTNIGAYSGAGAGLYGDYLIVQGYDPGGMNADVQYGIKVRDSYKTIIDSNGNIDEEDPIWISERSGYATGTPVYVESDSVWTNDKATGFVVDRDIYVLAYHTNITYGVSMITNSIPDSLGGWDTNTYGLPLYPAYWKVDPDNGKFDKPSDYWHPGLAYWFDNNIPVGSPYTLNLHTITLNGRCKLQALAILQDNSTSLILDNMSANDTIYTLSSTNNLGQDIKGILIQTSALNSPPYAASFNNITMVADVATLYCTTQVVVKSGDSFSSGDIVPTASNVYSIGSEDLPYKDGWFSGESLHIGSATLSDKAGGGLVIDKVNYETIYTSTNVIQNGDISSTNNWIIDRYRGPSGGWVVNPGDNSISYSVSYIGFDSAIAQDLPVFVAPGAVCTLQFDVISMSSCKVQIQLRNGDVHYGLLSQSYAPSTVTVVFTNQSNVNLDEFYMTLTAKSSASGGASFRNISMTVDSVSVISGNTADIMTEGDDVDVGNITLTEVGSGSLGVIGYENDYVDIWTNGFTDVNSLTEGAKWTASYPTYSYPDVSTYSPGGLIHYVSMPPSIYPYTMILSNVSCGCGYLDFYSLAEDGSTTILATNITSETEIRVDITNNTAINYIGILVNMSRTCGGGPGQYQSGYFEYPQLFARRPIVTNAVGGIESDPIWTSEKSGYATGTPLYVENHAGLATGTPVYVELDSTWDYARTNNSGYMQYGPIWMNSEHGGLSWSTNGFDDNDWIYYAFIQNIAGLDQGLFFQLQDNIGREFGLIIGVNAVDAQHGTNYISIINNASEDRPTIVDFSLANTTILGSNVLPSASNACTLGSADKPWKDIYVGTNSIHLGTNIISMNASGSLLVNGFAVPSGGMTVVITNVINTVTQKVTYTDGLLTGIE
jgi:hypothetical protein